MIKRTRTEKCITGKHYLYYTDPHQKGFTVLRFLRFVRWGISINEVRKNIMIFHDLVIDKDVMFYPDTFYELEDDEVDKYLMMKELLK